MTRGSWIHDDVSRHFSRCAQCRDTDPEEDRLRRPGRRDVSEKTLSAMCPAGREIYRSYLRWLSEPND